MAEYRYHKATSGANPIFIAGSLLAATGEETIDLNALQGRNARKLTITDDSGSASIPPTVELSHDGVEWSAPFPLLADEVFSFEDQDIHSVRLTTSEDFLYRLIAH